MAALRAAAFWKKFLRVLLMGASGRIAKATRFV
jgi:hypothetical protein